MGIKRNDGDSGVGEYQSAELMPPSPTAEIAKVLQAMKDSRRAWPVMFPDLPLDAAKFWISKQES